MGLALPCGETLLCHRDAPGYPPPRVNGVYISDFLTPHKATDFVYPASMQEEIQRVAGGYEFDVTFRAEDRERIGAQLTQMTRKHFAVARHLWAKEEWDFFAIHEIGPDRLHHTFWKDFDTHHPRYRREPEVSCDRRGLLRHARRRDRFATFRRCPTTSECCSCQITAVKRWPEGSASTSG